MDVIALRRVTLTELHGKKNLLPKEYETLIAGVVETLQAVRPTVRHFQTYRAGRCSRWSALRAQSRHRS